MTALELVNIWHRQRRIDPPLYELLIRRLTVPPFSPHAFNITGISAARLNGLIVSGEIGRVRGIGDARLERLRQLARAHHRALYVDVMQMTRLSERNSNVLPSQL